LGRLAILRRVLIHFMRRTKFSAIDLAAWRKQGIVTPLRRLIGVIRAAGLALALGCHVRLITI
jgi:hypothetical protein